MDIHIGAAGFGHDKAKALLLIEEFDVSVTHCAGGLTWTPGRAKSPASLSVPGLSVPGLSIASGSVHAVDMRNLHAALPLSDVAEYCCTLR
jgi:hypothetical protein